MDRQAVSRRTFLKGTGALLVAVSFAGALPTLADAAPDTTSTPLDPTKLDSYIKIGGDGTITAFTSKIEMGQGNQTALSQIVAEELYVPLSSINLVMGDSARSIQEFGTDASRTIADTGSNLRVAAAEARKALVDMAAAQWNMPADSLTTSNGAVTKADGSATVTYAQLVGDKTLNITLKALTAPDGSLVPFTTALNGTATPKDPSAYTLVGTSAPRVDIPPKVTGQFTYMQDVKVPGMLHGRVVRPTGIQSKLIGIGGFDPPVPGAQVVTQGDFVGVVAENEWDAIKAQSALQVAWSDWNELPAMDDIESVLRTTPPVKTTLVSNAGDVGGALAGAATVLNATYQNPFQMHASIGPSCAVADVQGDHATIYSATQNPHPMKGTIGTLLNIPPENVHVMNVEGSGCYGLNGADDVTTDAALMSQLVGKPVRVQYMRQDEHRWEPKGPAMLNDFQGGLDAGGNIVAWSHTAWVPPNFSAPNLTYVLAGMKTPPGLPGNLPNWGTALDYSFPSVWIVENEQSTFVNAIRSANIRGPGWTQYVFAKEAFIDELAAAAGRDPIEFRMAYLSDQRTKDVLAAAANAANWDARPSPSAGAAANSGVRTGRGVAIVNYNYFGGDVGTRVAEIAEVQVDTSTGAVRLTRVWAAHDCGLIVNPKAVQAQVESGVIQGASRALKEQVTFDDSNVTSVDWRGYPILTYPEIPQINTTLINRPDQPSSGAGEPATVPIAAAISNAIFDAIGVRLRASPFVPDAVLAALQTS